VNRNTKQKEDETTSNFSFQLNKKKDQLTHVGDDVDRFLKDYFRCFVASNEF
jgi:hypothetical protein